ncbi:L-dopachrome tautomerase-related protein [Frigidibacter sp. MR17.14]|uniref:L-dopachrome tautomerase-related protein n=1 Tax=Frigidibacter sp. MR17.14 TaxID=3126509 RepID=UPI0030131A94
MTMKRRRLLAAMASAVALPLVGARAGRAEQAGAHVEAHVALRSPWMANQVAVTSDGTFFLGLPRYAKDKLSPALARCEADGVLRPFPGNDWNDWAPGKDGAERFVYLNSVHVFGDDTIWCVDQGALSAGVFGPDLAVPQPGAQKIVQLDLSGEVLRILRFDETILPVGGQMNDLRRHGDLLYIADSGLGGLIVHDLATGKSLRRLSGVKVTMADPDAHIPAVLAHVKGDATFHPPNSDLIELTADGKWLYWASPTRPLWRVRTKALRDVSLSEEALAEHVQNMGAMPFSGGSAMDDLGNFYFCETTTNRLEVRSPEGKTVTLLEDERLVRPDGGFIKDRTFYVPVKVPLAEAGDNAAPPYAIYSIALPDAVDGVRLGSQIRT